MYDKKYKIIKNMSESYVHTTLVFARERSFFSFSSYRVVDIFDTVGLQDITIRYSCITDIVTEDKKISYALEVECAQYTGIKWQSLT